MAARVKHAAQRWPTANLLLAAVVMVAAFSNLARADPARPDAAEMIAGAVKAGERTWQNAQGPAASLTSRELFTYALALAEAREHPERLQHLFDVAARMQDRNPKSRNYGNFRWSWSHPEVMDRNAVEFSMQGGALLWMRHRDWIPEPARATLREILDFAVQGCLQHGVGPAYTNIALMNAENLILLGETLERPEVAEEGYRRFDRFIMHTYDEGISEYASPCYYGVDLDCLLLIERFCQQDRTRQQARAVLELFWTDVAAHFFPPSERLAGPHSRDYNYLRGNGSVLDNHLWVEGWLPGEQRGGLGLLWPALARWRPPERLHEMSRTRLPRLICQSWRAAPHQARTHYVLRDVTLGSAAANYGNMDLPLTVDLPGDPRFPRCYFIPDAQQDPYGQEKISEGSGAHSKTLHLRPFWTAAQRRTDALGLVLYRNEAQTRDARTLESHFVMPKDVDGFWVGATRVDVSGAKPAEWAVPGGTPVVLRLGTAAVGVRMVWARRADGGDASAALVYDGNRHGVVRLTVPHHTADGVPADVSRAGAAFWVRVGSGLATDEAFEAWRRSFAETPSQADLADGRLALRVPGADGPVAVEVAYPEPGDPVLEPPPSLAVLDIDGEDVGRGILERVEPLRSYVAFLRDGPRTRLAPGEGAYLEAESGYVFPPMVAAADPGASGGAHVWTPGEPGGHGPGQGCVLWNLDVPAAGAYHVWGRVLAPTPSDDSFFVDIFDSASRRLGRVEWHTGTAKEWRWVRLTDRASRKPVAVPLPEGKVRLEICTREDGAKLDRLFLTPDAETEPE